jgi:hypothetical protein
VLAAGTAPPPAVLDLVASHKAGIVALLRPANDGWSGEDWLAFFDERAGIAELDGRLSRLFAEARAFAMSTKKPAANPPKSTPASTSLSIGP